MNITTIGQIVDEQLAGKSGPVEITSRPMAEKCLLALAEGWRLTFEEFQNDGYLDMPEGLERMVDLASRARKNGYNASVRLHSMDAIALAREEYGPGWEDVEVEFNYLDLASFLHAAEDRAA